MYAVPIFNIDHDIFGEHNFKSRAKAPAATTMPSAVDSNRRVASPSNDNNHNYDQAVDDFMRDLDFDNENTNANAAPQEPPKDIDEEVQVKKKRKPNPKLDEARLLSQNGVPKLRKLTRSKLRFRGKGHEYTDITTLLNMYQLWLDDLYPKAKFRDGLAMIEKVGHTKRMQVTRRGWLDATKPYRREDSPERIGDVQMSGGLGDAGGEDEAERRVGAQTGEDGDTANRAPQEESGAAGQGIGGDDAPEDDELDALLNENKGGDAPADTAPRKAARVPFEEDSDAEDELDALLAEGEGGGREKIVSQTGTANKLVSGGEKDTDDFEDDEEALASMGW